MVAFFIPGPPKAQPRPRVYATGGKVRAVSNPKGSAVATFKDAVRLFARQAMAGQKPLTGPVWCNLLFLMPRPVRDRSPGRGWHCKRPDADNAAKAVLDAANGILFVDDAQVCFLEIAKRTVDLGEEPGVYVRVVAAE